MSARSIRQLARDAADSYDGSCLIYFAQAEDCGPVKIGITSAARLKRRIEELQSGCPWRILLRRTMPGSRALEQALQQTFRPWRLNGEWFYPTHELTDLAHTWRSPVAPHDSFAMVSRP